MKKNKSKIKFNKRKILNVLTNKYLIVTLLFIVWMIFFDENSLLMHYEMDQEKNRLLYEKAKFQKILKNDNEMLFKLKHNKSEREKYARENYFMKKNNEDIFIIVSDTTK